MMQQKFQSTSTDDETLKDPRFDLFAAKMRSAEMAELAIRIFHHYYNQVAAGATGYIDSNTGGPVDHLPDYDDLDEEYHQAGMEHLSRTIVLKLNGGLGTSMGMTGPKSLITVKEGLSFLDIIVRQVLYLRRKSGVRLPLVLMNSFNTRTATLKALETYSGFIQDIPIDFLQHKKPKIWKDTLLPAEWPDDPEKEWCPPGHGDIYVALLTSGILETMLEAGYEYLFVSNSDNLGAVLDTKILGYFASRQLPFLMEVAFRTPADKKGGHLSRRPDGQLILRESSQCPPDELELFQDIHRYRYFNTNNLWLHLPTLHRVLHEHGDMLDLPLIRNEKPVDPTAPDSPRVYQLETAMGSAISLFEGAQALRVPRIRFVPVKKNNDLLLLWSDAYRLTEDYRLVLTSAQANPSQDGTSLIDLDDRYYQMIEDLYKRFPYGAPSLRNCSALQVEGNVYFGKDVVIEGAVHLTNPSDQPMTIADGSHLVGDQ